MKTGKIMFTKPDYRFDVSVQLTNVTQQKLDYFQAVKFYVNSIASTTHCNLHMYKYALFRQLWRFLCFIKAHYIKS